MWYDGRQRQSGEGLTSTAAAQRCDDDEDDGGAQWRRFKCDFGLNAARLRAVGRLRRDSSWDRTPPPPNSTQRSTDRDRDHIRLATSVASVTASHSLMDGQSLSLLHIPL